MSLVIEDGTGVEGAVSFASADELYLYAVEREIEITSDIGSLEAMLLKAMDYIETFSHKFLGDPVSATQPLSFPRTVSDGIFGSVELGVPPAIKKAQIVIALASTSVQLLPVSSNTDVTTTRKTVGPITVEYEKGPSTTLARIPQADALLRPYFRVGFGQPTVVRG